MENERLGQRLRAVAAYRHPDHPLCSPCVARQIPTHPHHQRERQGSTETNCPQPATTEHRTSRGVQHQHPLVHRRSAFLLHPYSQCRCPLVVLGGQFVHPRFGCQVCCQVGTNCGRGELSFGECVCVCAIDRMLNYIGLKLPNHVCILPTSHPLIKLLDDFDDQVCQALDLITDLLSSLDSQDSLTNLMMHTNHFQLYKLTAAFAQHHDQGRWTEHFRRPVSSAILPMSLLVWRGSPSSSVSAQSSSEAAVAAIRSPTRWCSLTAVCLARAIETLLRQFSLNSSSTRHDGSTDSTAEVQQKLYTSLLIACNEYFPTCFPLVRDWEGGCVVAFVPIVMCCSCVSVMKRRQHEVC